MIRLLLFWLALINALAGVIASVDADMISAILFATIAAICAGLASVLPAEEGQR